MKRILLLSMICVMSMGLPLRGDQLLMECDFTKDLHEVHNKGAGSFDGLLPKNCGDNFSGWLGSTIKTQLMKEEGKSFLRFDVQKANGQFAVSMPKTEFPGFFKLVISCRAFDEGLPMGIRLNGAPYRSYWSGRAKGLGWEEETILVHIKEQPKSSVGLYLYPAVGKIDLKRIALYRTDSSAFVAAIRRPPKSVKQFIRHQRFPMGLPCGWNAGREFSQGICDSDSEHPAADGVPVLRARSADTFTFYSEPFQPAIPKKAHTISFQYQANGAWEVHLMRENGWVIRSMQIKPASSWREARMEFNPGELANNYLLRIKGTGEFRMDRLSVFIGKEKPADEFASSVTLQPTKGEITENTKIQFLDEPATMDFCVLDAPKDSVLKSTVTDLYGDTKALPDRALQEGKIVRGNLNYMVLGKRPMGQFRVESWVENNGKRISLIEENVVTRLPRPIYWKKDAPDSAFGSHFIAREGTVQSMKACGVNWARLHDAGTEYSGWWALEKEKGKWTFYDSAIDCYRRNNIKIFAQLGTAPAWASHYGDLGYKHMGYFEKYLRPTNRVDFINYVKTYVKHYDGVIDEYFIWNEPWGKWWKAAADAKYYDAKKTGIDFAALCKDAYQAVKSVNPDIKVSGFNTIVGTGGHRWTTEVYEGGGYDACDLIDFHFYTPNKRCNGKKDVPVLGEALKTIREHHPDYGGKPIYMSEGQGTSTGVSGVSGRMSGLYLHTVPWEPELRNESARYADYTCRYTISLLSEGVAKVYLYSAHAFSALGVKPSFLVLLGADGYPHPALVAYAQMTQKLENKKFQKIISHGAEGRGYVFSDGKKSCTVYTGLSKEEALALASHTHVTDLYGNSLAAENFLPMTLVYSE